MYAQIPKSIENRSKAVANSITHKQSDKKQGFGFVDNRPEAVAQRKLQEKANSSSQQKRWKLHDSLSLKSNPGGGAENATPIQGVWIFNMNKKGDGACKCVNDTSGNNPNV